METHKYWFWGAVIFIAGASLGIGGQEIFRYCVQSESVDKVWRVHSPVIMIIVSAGIMGLVLLFLLSLIDIQKHIDSYIKGIKEKFDEELSSHRKTFSAYCDEPLKNLGDRVGWFQKESIKAVDDMRASFFKTEATRKAYREKIMLHAYNVGISRLRDGDSPENTDAYIKKVADEIHRIDNDPRNEEVFINSAYKKKRSSYEELKGSLIKKPKMMVCRECKSQVICPNCGKQIERGDAEWR